MNADITGIYIVFSDSVIRENGTAKVSLIGTFHQYSSAFFPLPVPPFCITTALTNIRGLVKEALTLATRIEEPKTGQIIASTVGSVGLPPDYNFTGKEVIDVPISIPGMVLQAPGSYLITVMVNGEKIISRDLPINLVQNSPQKPIP